LGTSPTEEEIASLAATRAQEYIVECFDDDSSNLDKEKFDAIPRYTKSDLMIGQFLGKGSFSDAFEVILTVHATQPELKPGRGSDAEKDGGEDLDSLVAAAAGQFGGNDGSAGDSKPTSLHSSSHQSRIDVDPPARRRPRRATAAHLSRSVCLGTVQSPAVVKPTRKTLAMKCLRPQIRANAEHFLIGVEDLIHETAMLAALDHPNIIKIHGRSGGSVSDSFRLSDGYFILLDRLTDTLEDRIKQWQKAPLASKKGPTVNQIKVFSAIADAILFLHQNHICFRDLKPVSEVDLLTQVLAPFIVIMLIIIFITSPLH
jgi:serine/threonine protein kinase